MPFLRLYAIDDSFCENLGFGCLICRSGFLFSNGGRVFVDAQMKTIWFFDESICSFLGVILFYVRALRHALMDYFKKIWSSFCNVRWGSADFGWHLKQVL